MYYTARALFTLNDKQRYLDLKHLHQRQVIPLLVASADGFNKLVLLEGLSRAEEIGRILQTFQVCAPRLLLYKFSTDMQVSKQLRLENNY